MVEFPAAGHAIGPPPSPSPKAPRNGHMRPGWLPAGLLAVTVGLTLVVLPATFWVYPDLLPFAAPLMLLAGALALWGAARLDQVRIAAAARRLTEENAQLIQNLGWLSDTAHELRESQGALDEARQRAEAASQAKSRLLATVSHEFRTPLNGILGLTGLLLETDQTADQRTYARAVYSSGEALLALVDDMLDFSKIEAGRLDLRPQATELEALLQEIAELLAARAHGKGIDIAADVALDVPAVMVDTQRLRQVLLNLAGNGVKFTEHGGVTLSASLARPIAEGRAGIEFSVTDTGPGIPQEAVGRLFREFEQLDPAPTRRHGGAGLGLAISRRIVRAMAGEIALQSRPRGGSVFSFLLDLPVMAISPAAPLAVDTPRDLSGRAVLIIAPEGAEPRVLQQKLVQHGADARVAATAYEAAALLGAAAAAGQPYAALLVDARAAPEPAAVLARVREAAGGRVPAAVLIEPGKRRDVEALRAAGFDAYLVRPVRGGSLLRIVGEVATATGDDFRVDPGDVAPRASSAQRAFGAHLRVLLAEDNEINALLARAVLERLGHTVDEVHDGAAAVAAATAAAQRYGLILMDLHMPGLDGLAAVRAIRAHERDIAAERTRILAVTADVLAETRAAALAAGVDQVVEKPMTPESLRRALAVVAGAAA